MRSILSTKQWIIFFAMFSTGLASLLYEVVLISVVTTVVGATELALSIVLASFLFGLASGALLGGLIVKKKWPLFLFLIGIEFLVALFGFSFLSLIIQFVSSGFPDHFIFWLIVFSLLIPTTLMGMEIPIAVSILEKAFPKKKSTGFVYFADTLGGVMGALFTGLVFIPALGFHGAMYLGASLNILSLVLVSRLNKRKNTVFFLSVAFLFFLVIIGFFMGTSFWQDLRLYFVDSFFSIGSAFYAVYYTAPVFTTQTPYQHIVILESPYYGRQLFLDGELQILGKASLKYHEYLVMPAFAAQNNPKKVLLIGGGDGGALHQIIKFDVSEIHHVDLDSRVIEVSKQYLPSVHRGSFDDPRIQHFIEDGRIFLKNSPDEYYDVIIIDLPDPKKLALAPLYSQEFYKEVKRVLRHDGVMITQFISPYFYLEAFTSAHKTIHSVMPNSHPYVVPGSLHGSLGYIVAGKNADPRMVNNQQVEGKWYSTKQNEYLFEFPKFLEEYFKDNNIQITTDNNPIIHVYMQNNYFYRGAAD